MHKVNCVFSDGSCHCLNVKKERVCIFFGPRFCEDERTCPLRIMNSIDINLSENRNQTENTRSPESKYPCTSKITFQFQKLSALEELERKYVEANKHEMAKRIALLWQVQRDKAWKCVYEIYPELRYKDLNYNSNKGITIRP